MKLDLNNPYISFLVGSSDLTNGCSVIRTMLLRILMCLGGAVVALVVATAALFIVAGLGVYLYSPWFGQMDVGLSMSWLGNAWWADWLRTGAKIGIVLSILGSVIGSVVLFVMQLKRAVDWIRADDSSASTIAKAISAHRVTQTIMAPFNAVGVVWGACSDLAHKICPNVVLVLPEDIQRLIETPELFNLRTDYCGGTTWVIDRTEWRDEGKRLRFYLRSTDYDNDYRRDWVSYNPRLNDWNERVELIRLPE